MKNQIASFINDMRLNKKILNFDEASVKQAVIMRLLSILNWDIFNVEEVTPDVTVQSKEIDYALRFKNSSKVFILVKKPSEALDAYQKYLLDLAKKESVEISVLTNGLEWWFYLSLGEESPDQKRINTVEMLKDEPGDISAIFEELLNKENIISGSSVESAKTILLKQKQKSANNSVYGAWNKIISEKDKGLVKLISDRTEEVSGYRAENSCIEKFLDENLSQWLVLETPVAKEDDSVTKQNPEEKPFEKSKESESKKAKPKSKNYAGESISAFTFEGNTYEVSSWDEMLMTLCEIFVTKNKDDFDKVLWISGQNRSYFSNIENELRRPEKIKRTSIYVETHLGPNEAVNTALSLISAFGYASKDLSISLKEK